MVGRKMGEESRRREQEYEPTPDARQIVVNNASASTRPSCLSNRTIAHQRFRTPTTCAPGSDRHCDHLLFGQKARHNLLRTCYRKPQTIALERNWSMEVLFTFFKYHDLPGVCDAASEVRTQVATVGLVQIELNATYSPRESSQTS